MRQMRVWTIVVFFALLISEISYTLFYDFLADFSVGFSSDPLMFFVYIW